MAMYGVAPDPIDRSCLRVRCELCFVFIVRSEMHQRNNLTILEGEIFIQQSKQIGSILITDEALGLPEKLI